MQARSQKKIPATLWVIQPTPLRFDFGAGSTPANFPSSHIQIATQPLLRLCFPSSPTMATGLLRLSISSQPRLCFNFSKSQDVGRVDFIYPSSGKRCRSFKRRCILRPHSGPNLFISNSLETRTESSVLPFLQPQQQSKDSPVLLDVSGMMCGACVSRVKSILSADDRVDSVVVNMLTETAAIKLKNLEAAAPLESVADSLARRLSDCGFPTKRRLSGLGVAENVNKWKELVKKKEELLVKSRNRVAFAWTLVALCCGSHASHIFHSLGIHIGHGNRQPSSYSRVAKFA